MAPLRSFFAFLVSLAFAAAAAAQEAPADAVSWVIVSAGGKHGEEKAWTDESGALRSTMKIVLRGLTYDVEQTARVNEAGLPVSFVVTGVTPSGDAGETFSVESEKAIWKSPVDSGEAPWRDGLFYAPFGGTAQAGAIMIDALTAREDKRLDTLPGGAVTISELTRLDVSAGGETKSLKAMALDGLSFDTQVIWTNDDHSFFGTVGWLSWLPKGWEGVREDLIEAQQAALSARAPAQRAALLKSPEGPVLFRNVTIYDSASKDFKKSMSVLVEGDRIAAVGPRRGVKAPRGAAVIDGKGATLVPGLWDMHHHLGQDGAGLLALSQGVTSVRDIGNEKATLLARKKRIDDGELLGPRVYPIVGVDGDGPLSAQGFVRIQSVEEGVAAIAEAQEEGHLGIKLYGTIDPEWVVPLAAEAHRLGMSVQGHIPAGMRPSAAVEAGYDGINHINFVVMEAMPEDVLETSNGLNRFFGPGRYAKDLDLSAEPMASFLATLAERKTVIDPTLTVYESIFVPEAGEVAAAAAPFLGVVPPQVERRFKSGGLVAPEGYEASREDMRASFEKLIETVAQMREMGVPIVAGTDGPPWDLIRELELYVRAGMSIGEALETATHGAARVFGLDGETGSIAEGMTADLLLVDGDVSKNLGALRQVRAVMLGGALLDGEEMREAAGFTGLPAK